MRTTIRRAGATLAIATLGVGLVTVATQTAPAAEQQLARPWQSCTGYYIWDTIFIPMSCVDD